MSRFTSLYLRVPRPKNLFGFISLQTGTELITLMLILNKVTGVYGLLAILTGYQLSLLQLATYVYSLVSLGVVVYLAPHIRRQSAVECLALAWLYVVDTTVNTADTVAFGSTWYPATTTTKVGNIGTVAVATVGAPPRETAASMVLLVAHTLVRIYYSLVVMSFARQVIQSTVQTLVINGEADVVDSPDGPFAQNLPDGQGRRGRAGRTMVSFIRGYWLEQPLAGWTPEGASTKGSVSAKARDFS
ncbi:Inositolphosphorylceramide synthase subunit Kei1 [Geosmithia morbida]|uniref:Inositolphosphorylceramide synthase subunit Kei1 n=1 Tax=Geosmithia morbida TaxID=1094350 RepID=A0A9P4YYS5_9HYPO|nr:Inositolphosphorylceramide synthase subunit Kei1 [Geosmithia morbida]KAF4125385.1 Inositolphosphorylceramide synthase subunit Kei1 [Geosmithia morbida]